MLFAWLLTLPGAGLVGGLAALLSDRGVGGVIALIVFLCVSCTVIYLISRKHSVNATNVTDSAEVLVLASAAPDTYVDDPRFSDKPHVKVKAKAKGAA
jgi:PiT family inorganic phosphate transporter